MQNEAKILYLQEAADNIFYLVMEHPEIAREADPGQFVFVRVEERLSPFLRRPFSIAGVSPEKGTVELLFSIVGEATKIMSKMQPGQTLNCLGPLGSGFKESVQNGPVLLAAGGIGIAPLIFLSRHLVQNRRESFLFYGAASSSDLVPLEEFCPSQVKMFFSTEDGSKGVHGFVTQALKEAFNRESFSPVEIFACGPRVMLHSLSVNNKEWNLPMQVSLEERMACGVGACRGCAVEMHRNGETIFKRVCHDGPVFDCREVIW